MIFISEFLSVCIHRGICVDIANCGWNSSCCLQGQGDFFKSIPKGCDCYILKYIIHDWNDEEAKIILNNCNKAMKKGDTLLLIELTIDEVEFNWYRLYLDILLLSSIGGKERTIKQFKNLLKDTGFNYTKVIRTRSFMSIIEAKKM